MNKELYNKPFFNRTNYHLKDAEMRAMGLVEYPDTVKDLFQAKQDIKPKDKMAFHRQRAAIFTHFTFNEHFALHRAKAQAKEQEKQEKRKMAIDASAAKRAAAEGKRKAKKDEIEMKKLAQASRKNPKNKNDITCFLCGFWEDAYKRLVDANASFVRCRFCLSIAFCPSPAHKAIIAQHKQAHKTTIATTRPKTRTKK
jgi:hypothetical protein